MQCFAAWALWFLGQPDQSLARIQETLTLTRELSEPLSLAYALSFAAILHQLRREEGMAQEQAEAAIAVSSEHGLVMFQAMATIMRAWALTQQGRTGEAIEQMRQGLADLRATGTELFRPHFLALLAEALDKARQVEEGLRVLDQALAEAHCNGERNYQAELYRLKGELLLNQPKAQVLSRSAKAGHGVSEAESPAAVAGPESCFHQSIQIARRQQAKSLELRAVVSLARLHRKSRKREEMRGLLAQIYGSFTEGFDTRDLREAKALLDELS
jgi:predicted ATPase